MKNDGIGQLVDLAGLPLGGPTSIVRATGIIKATAVRPDGSIRWESLSKNGVTNLGFNLMLDSMFRNGTATIYANWYIGLISNASYSALAAGDTMSSHAGWTEDSTHYTPAVSGQRPTWTPTAASGKSITNTTSVNFAMNTDNTVIKGIFVVTDNTIGGTSGVLWSTGLFSADQTLFNGDTLKITYTVNLS